MQTGILTEKQKRRADLAAGDRACPVCAREVNEENLTWLHALDKKLANLIRANAPNAVRVEAICSRCAKLFERAETHISTEAAVQKDGSHVLSTPLRLDADDRFTGKDVTIAFLDSGFYPHVDLTSPHNRILAYHSLLAPNGDISSLFQPDAASWHGMMTSVVAAGNGNLSNGFYRGLAPEANVVLVKLAKSGRITSGNIQEGLEWVLAHREQFNIRVVNISAGGDDETAYLQDALCQTVERATAAGLTIICACGNSGHAPNHPVYPPASAPSAIAVGGLDDNNSIDRTKRGMYRSSFGPTVDGLQKPEIIAPSIWIPAPILPNTPTAKEVELLEKLDKAADSDLHKIVRANKGIDAALDNALDRPAYALRQIIALKWREESAITRYYKYVDGTSFSAPIVASLAACLLEANPNLTPQQIKRILIGTAERLPHIEVDRQGWGVVNPRAAVEAALRS